MPSRPTTKLTKPQREAILAMIQRIKIDGPNAHCAYGPGGTDITRTTATALRDMGLVDLHSEVSSRPAKAGFGNPRNWKTVYTANRWMTATPRFLEMLRGKKLIPRENTGRKNPRTRGDEYGIRTVGVENQTLYVERETRTNRRTGKTRTVGYNLYTAHPWNDPGAVCVGSGDTLMNAAEHARHAMEVRPWVFKTQPVQRPA